MTHAVLSLFIGRLQEAARTRPVKRHGSFGKQRKLCCRPARPRNGVDRLSGAYERRRSGSSTCSATSSYGRSEACSGSAGFWAFFRDGEAL